ncbi:hypothetical protein ACHAQJ_000940 [Trichoderma viride]
MEQRLNTIGASSSKSKEKQPLSIRFLNLTNPNDATKSEALTAIRSHVAKNTHGRKQESRRTHLEIRQYRPATRGGKTKDLSSQEKADAQLVQEASEFNVPVVRRRKSQEGSRLPEPEIWIPNPQTFVTTHRRNPFQISAKSISNSENALVDHYITYVVDHGYTDCIHNETEQQLLQNVRSRFVPWSLTERGLQAGLFMAACRSLLVLNPEYETYRVSLLKYKSECIEILRAALSDPGRSVSDYTIALALVLSTEEFLSGNIIESRLHGEAIIKMVHLRGGFKDLGPGGLLGYFLARSVYNPVFQFVDGPDATELAN